MHVAPPQFSSSPKYPEPALFDHDPGRSLLGMADDGGQRETGGADPASTSSAVSAAQATSSPPDVCGSVSSARCPAGSRQAA